MGRKAAAHFEFRCERLKMIYVPFLIQIEHKKGSESLTLFSDPSFNLTIGFIGPAMVKGPVSPLPPSYCVAIIAEDIV